MHANRLRKGVVRLSTAGVLAAFASLFATRLPEFEWLRLSDLDRRILLVEGLRAWSELAVVVLQVAAVALLGLWRAWPTARWAGRACSGFVAATVGVGLCGSACAWCGSEFALFAGATVSALLIAAILGHHPAAPPRSGGRAVATEPA